jgi:2-dehydropantoate 2-reductase
MDSLRVAVVGAGAVGAYYGGRLAEAGHDVSFYTRSGTAALREGGLHVSSIAGDFVLPEVKAFDNTTEIGTCDLIIVALKTTAINSYIDLVTPLVGNQSSIICLQNGLGNEEVFGQVFGADRIFGAIAFTCINRTTPNQIIHTAHGYLRIGPLQPMQLDRAESFASLFVSANVPAEAVFDLQYHRWEKLVWNIPFNGWGTALDLHTAAMLASTAGERLIRQTMAETIRAAAAVGVRLNPSVIDSEIARTRLMGNYHSSMQLDRHHNRPLEIESILALPLRLASTAGETNLPLMISLLACLRAVNPPPQSGGLMEVSNGHSLH